MEKLDRREMLTTFFVATDGNDGQSVGSIDQPFASVARANAFAQPGDTVFIRGGTYRETASAVSGTEGNPITYAAYNNEEVVFSGADRVTGWTQVPGQSNVWVADLAAQGFDVNTGGNRANNTVFVNGELRFEARERAENDPVNIDDWGELRQNDLTTTTLRSNDLIGFGNDFWNGAQITFHRNDFTTETRTIADYNSSTGTVTFDTAIPGPGLKQTGGFYIFDSFNALDQAGEWYRAKPGEDIDGDGVSDQNKLYYKAAPGENPNNLEIEFKQRAYGFDTRGQDYVNIEGIEFRGVSINTSAGTEFNTYTGNTFYGYDKGQFGRFFLRGNNNTIRDGVLAQTYVVGISVDGVRNSIVNNLLEEHGYNAITKVLTTSSNTEELLFSHNTVRRFAEAFLDGYPSRSEFAYNVFEEGGLLSFDTGVFDSDGQNGNASQSIFHHNIFRNTQSRGIYEAFYGRNDNAVIHNNLFYDFNSVLDRASLRTTGLEFRQVYHNTVISTVDRAPLGSPNARFAVQTRYNNNLQISIDRQASLGVDLRGNFNYSPSDFVNFAGDDYRLAPGSGAIDAGILIPGINDDFLGDAPDAGAFEFGATPWVAGHNFADPPPAVYGWQPLVGTNLDDNGQFFNGLEGWNIVSGTPNAADRNSFNLQLSGAGLTDSPRTQSVEFTPGEGVSRLFTDLKPNTTYTIGAAARLANEFTRDAASGATVGTHREIIYATNLSGSDWIRFDVDLGEPGQFDQIDLLHIRNPSTFPARANLAGVSVQVRVGSPTGQLVAEFDNLNDGLEIDRWRADRADLLSDLSGPQSLFFSVQGANSNNLALGTIRLLNSTPPTTDRLSIRASAAGTPPTTFLVGSTDWELGFEELSFTTGPTADSVALVIQNNGRLNAYLDRVYLVEGNTTRGGAPREVSIGAEGEFLDAGGVINSAPNLNDGDRTTATVTADVPGAYVQLDLGADEGIYGIEIAPPSTQPNRLSNFRVSVWSDDPNTGGTQLWAQDYLTDGSSLFSSQNLFIQGDTFGLDGQTRLNDVQGSYVRLELIGENSAGTNELAVGEVKVLAFAETNVGLTDSITVQSSTAPGFEAANATDGDPNTRSRTLATGFSTWIEARLPQGFGIGQIELVNHDGDSFGELSNFRVSVWDAPPSEGGTQLWQRDYFSSGSVGRGATLTIDGSEIDQGGTTRRLASLHTGSVVRVQLNGLNNEGNSTLSLAELRVTPADSVAPINNLAQQGIATQSSDFYGEAGADGETSGRFGFASTAIDGTIIPAANFTSALNIPNQWWQVDLQQSTPIDQIVLFNRSSAGARLDNFDVEVWSGDPDAGGSLLWDNRYQFSNFASTYSTGSTIGDGGALLIDGSDTDNGLRLDQVTGGRFVRVQLNDSDILSLVEVQVWAPDSLLRNPTDQTDFVFDLGTEESAVAGGTQGVSPTTYGDVTWTGDVTAIDRGGSGANRDFVTGSGPATFNQTLANGDYEVTVDFGDPSVALQNQLLFAEGALIDGDIDSTTGSPTQVTFITTVTDGELNLSFDSASSAWAVSRIEVAEFTAPAPLLPGDFNNDRAIDLGDFVSFRDLFGASTALPNENASLGQVDRDDYDTFQANYGLALPDPVTTSLISATIGNGEFNVVESESSLIGNVGDTFTLAPNQDRAFRVSTAIGLGVDIGGWQIFRSLGLAGNAAFGVVGNLGFEPNTSTQGLSPGITGQAFANSGGIDVISDLITGSFFAGDEFDLSYFAGTDVGENMVDADVTLTFNAGDASEFTHTFATRTATGLPTTAFQESYTLPQDASSVSVTFRLDGRVSGVRSLLDSVELSVTSDSGEPVSTAPSAAMAPAAAVVAPAPVESASAGLEAFAALPADSGLGSSIQDVSSTAPEGDLDDDLLLLLAADVTTQQPGAAIDPLDEQEEPEGDDELESLAIDLAMQTGV